MERAAGLKPMHELEQELHELEQELHELKTRARELLSEAIRDLRNASGRIENELTWCSYDERTPLFAMRHEIEQEMRKLHQGASDPAEALQLRESAAQRLVQVQGWRKSQDAAKAAAETERLRDRQQRPDADPAPEHDPSTPRLG